MPHLVIAQILTEEPPRPRQLRPDLPRDLETVILTCLAKEPLQAVPERSGAGKRPRAVIEGRPIQARRAPVGRTDRALRPPAAEDAGRRRRGRGGHGLAHDRPPFGAWRYYADWRLGRVVLTTDGPPLAAELLPESSERSADRRAVRRRCSAPSSPCRPAITACASRRAGLMSQTYRGRVQPRRDARLIT